MHSCPASLYMGTRETWHGSFAAKFCCDCAGQTTSIYFVATTVTRARANVRHRNHIFIPLVILSNTFGNCLLAIGMQHMPDFLVTSLSSYLLALITNPWILGGVSLLTIWMVSQLSMFTWADLSYVLPVTASGYIVTAILGKWLLGEQVSSMRWGGTVLITFGSMLVSRTPVRTKPHFRGRDR